VCKSSWPSNYFQVSLFAIFLIELKSVSNSAFLEPILNFDETKYFGVILALSANFEAKQETAKNE